MVPPPTRYSETAHAADYDEPESGEDRHSQRNASWHAPHIGEHSADCLREVGFGAAEVVRLTAEGGAVPPASGRWAGVVPRL